MKERRWRGGIVSQFNIKIIAVFYLKNNDIDLKGKIVYRVWNHLKIMSTVPLINLSALKGSLPCSTTL